MDLAVAPDEVKGDSSCVGEAGDLLPAFVPSHRSGITFGASMKAPFWSGIMAKQSGRALASSVLHPSSKMLAPDFLE